MSRRVLSDRFTHELGRLRRRIVKGHEPLEVIVADTGAILALLDKGDRHHAAVRDIYEENPQQWLLP